jgi:hypothetical protein
MSKENEQSMEYLMKKTFIYMHIRSFGDYVRLQTPMKIFPVILNCLTN